MHASGKVKIKGEILSVDGAAAVLRYVARKYSPDRLRGCGPGDIRNVLVINSASRSGSSFLYSLLSKHPDVISLNGEDLVFQKLHGLFPLVSAADSDGLPAGFKPGRAAVRAAAGDMLLDSGCGWDGRGAFPAGNYAADCVRRFLLQWPASVDPDSLYACAAAAVKEELSRGPGFSPARCWTSFLARANGAGAAADPRRYDLPRAAGTVAPPSRPPAGDFLLEEPPFVVPAPKVFPAPGSLGGKTLLLKSSSNCYRAGLLAKFFPEARYKYILLARNPMASVSGLMDGWLSGGFFSRDVGALAELSIKGYTVAGKSWTRRWWKFDLPPGWAGYARRSLEEVCAFQWRSANARILSDSASGVFGEELRVKYEDLSSPEGLRREMTRILRFAGLPAPGARIFEAARPVMSVTAPRPGKWLKRRRVLLPLFKGELEMTAAGLGYVKKEVEKWP